MWKWWPTLSCEQDNLNKISLTLPKESPFERGMCIKGLIWPPLEPKTENCFSQISFDWFVRNMTEV